MGRLRFWIATCRHQARPQRHGPPYRSDPRRLRHQQMQDRGTRRYKSDRPLVRHPALCPGRIAKVPAAPGLSPGRYDDLKRHAFSSPTCSRAGRNHSLLPTARGWCPMVLSITDDAGVFDRGGRRRGSVSRSSCVSRSRMILPPARLGITCCRRYRCSPRRSTSYTRSDANSRCGRTYFHRFSGKIIQHDQQTYCPHCDTTHEWFARDAWVCDSEPCDEAERERQIE